MSFPIYVFPNLRISQYGDDLAIRIAFEKDASSIHEIYTRRVEDSIATFEFEPPTVEIMWNRIETTLAAYPWIVSENGNRVQGYAYAAQHRPREGYKWSVTVSVYVDEIFHRQGIGRSLYVALFKLLRLQGFFNAYAAIALPNPASIGLHESLGFSKLGVYHDVGFKFGQWRDVGWWELSLQEKVNTIAEPAEPVPFNKLDSSEVDRILESSQSNSHRV